MPKVTQAHRDARREQILQAALACFAKDGFHQTGMADIVRRSGLSHGALYGYFASKDDIIEALADDRHQREAMLNEVATSGSDPIIALTALTRAYVATLADPTGMEARRVGVHGWAEALSNERVHARVVAGIEAARSVIVDLVQRGQRLGRIAPSIDAEAVARSLIALYQGFVLQLCWGEPLDLEACARVAERMLAGLFASAQSGQP